MKETRVALRYAKSLLSLAQESNVLEQVKDDVLTIQSVCEECPDFISLLKSPIVKTDKKLAIINEIFAKELSELSLSFLTLVTKKGREAILGSIANNFIALYNESKNIVKVSITTAVAIDEDLKAQVLAQLASIVNAEVQIEELVDENLIGGFVLRVGDKEYNASIAQKLQKLKRDFVSNPYIKER